MQTSQTNTYKSAPYGALLYVLLLVTLNGRIRLGILHLFEKGNGVLSKLQGFFAKESYNNRSVFFVGCTIVFFGYFLYICSCVAALNLFILMYQKTIVLTSFFYLFALLSVGGITTITGQALRRLGKDPSSFFKSQTNEPGKTLSYYHRTNWGIGLLLIFPAILVSFQMINDFAVTVVFFLFAVLVVYGSTLYQYQRLQRKS